MSLLELFLVVLASVQSQSDLLLLLGVLEDKLVTKLLDLVLTLLLVLAALFNILFVLVLSGVSTSC